MGQLEKYGLYVLCLVIFLILGVAIWGGDPAGLPPQPSKDIPKLAANDPGKPKEQPRDSNKEGGNQGKGDATKDQPKASPADAGKGQAEGIGAMLVPHTRSGEKDTKKEPGKELGKDPAVKPATEGGAAKPDTGKPATPPASGGATESKTRIYVVKDHDSLYRIAERELGSSSRLPEIESLNPTIKHGAIKKGDQIKLPAAKPHDAKAATPAVAKVDAADKAAAKAKPAAGATYKVQHGDTLVSISRAAYGTDKHVRAILAANSGKVASANSLKENTVLSLPAKP